MVNDSTRAKWKRDSEETLYLIQESLQFIRGQTRAGMAAAQMVRGQPRLRAQWDNLSMFNDIILFLQDDINDIWIYIHNRSPGPDFSLALNTYDRVSPRVDEMMSLFFQMQSHLKNLAVPSYLPSYRALEDIHERIHTDLGAMKTNVDALGNILKRATR